MKRLIILLILLLCTACQDTDKVTLSPITIAEVYPGNIMDVTMIELIDGSSGARVQLENKDEIDHLLNNIKDLVLEPDRNQEERTGYIYRLALYEGDELMLDFLPTVFDQTYYLFNEQLHGILQELYTEKFNQQY